MGAQTILLYDDAITPTASDTTADPKGPFAALLCLTSGTVKITTYMGTTQSIPMTAGSYLYVSVSRIWSTGTSGTYLGLRSAVTGQGW